MKYDFEVGEAFPAADPIARFVTGLAIVNNEWHRSMALMPHEDDEESRAIRLLLVRQQAAACHEATDFIVTARKHYSQIAEFIDGLNSNAQAHYNRIMAGLDPKSAHHQDWLQAHRHTVSHIPELHPAKFEKGTDAIANALGKAAKDTGSVSHGETAASVRFGFADVVAVRMLPDVTANPDLMKTLSGAKIALGGFVLEAVEAYLRSLPPGVGKLDAQHDP
jgi:hypothetical protein